MRIAEPTVLITLLCTVSVTHHLRVGEALRTFWTFYCRKIKNCRHTSGTTTLPHRCSGDVPLLPPCQQHLEDPALQVGQGVQGGLSPQRDPFLQLVPKTSQQNHILFAMQLREYTIWPIYDYESDFIQLIKASVIEWEVVPNTQKNEWSIIKQSAVLSWCPCVHCWEISTCAFIL